MAYDNSRSSFQPREMYKGNWTCSQCGNAITELPFEPDPSRVDNLKCRDCFRKDRPASREGRRPQQREMYKGNWTCSQCGNAITELPFEPDPSRVDNLKCFDCHKGSRSY